MMKLVIMILALVLSTQALANAGAAAVTCSGQVKLCESCLPQFFHIYTYQYAFVFNGEIRSENHNFLMGGFLGSAEDYRLISAHVSHRHILYSNGATLLAVPFMDANDGIWIAGGGGPIGYTAVPSMWIQLCPN